MYNYYVVPDNVCIVYVVYRHGNRIPSVNLLSLWHQSTIDLPAHCTPGGAIDGRESKHTRYHVLLQRVRHDCVTVSVAIEIPGSRIDGGVLDLKGGRVDGLLPAQLVLQHPLVGPRAALRRGVRHNVLRITKVHLSIIDRVTTYCASPRSTCQSHFYFWCYYFFAHVF